MATRLALRRDKTVNWTEANPVLAMGEPGYDEDNNDFKIGDGLTAWLDLPTIAMEGPPGPQGAAGDVTPAAVQAVVDAQAASALAQEAATNAASTAAAIPATNDPIVANLIGDDASQTKAALSDTYGAPAVADATTDMRKSLDRNFASRAESNVVADTQVITLLSGMDTESASILGLSCTLSADTTNFRVGDRGLMVTTAGAVVATAQVTPPGPVSPLVHAPAQAVGMWVYVPDPSKLSSITVQIYNSADLSAANRWVRAITSFVTGWNLVRWPANASSIGTWTGIYRVQALVSTSAATSVTIGQMWIECPRKAKLVVINDGAFRNFDTYIADPIHAMGGHTTRAVSCVNVGVGTYLTVSELLDRQALGDTISFHDYGGVDQITSTATAAQCRAWTAQAQRWLQQNGFNGWPFRSAWLQNNAPQAAAANSQVVVAATPTGQASTSTWPPATGSRYSIPRVTIHGTTSAQMDGYFSTLQTCHNMLWAYTHDVDDAGGENATHAEVDYFLAKCQAGIDAGWLELVTMEELLARSGGKWVQGFAGPQFEYTDEAGQLQVLRG